MTKLNKSLCVIMTVILIAGYLTVLYLALNPNVSEEYRNYYINRSTPLTPFEQKKAAKGLANPILKITFDAPNTMFTGWYSPEQTHRWSQGKQSSISFHLPTDNSPEGMLILVSKYFGDQQVLVEMNDRAIAQFESKTSPPELLLTVDPTLLKAGATNKLTFYFPDARKPGNGDQRELAMALLGIEIY